MKTFKVSRERAIIIASNHNNISLEKAKSYTDSELREVLRHLNLNLDSKSLNSNTSSPKTNITIKRPLIK